MAHYTQAQPVKHAFTNQMEKLHHFYTITKEIPIYYVELGDFDTEDHAAYEGLVNATFDFADPVALVIATAANGRQALIATTPSGNFVLWGKAEYPGITDYCLPEAYAKSYPRHELNAAKVSVMVTDARLRLDAVFKL